ncbi:MAG: hypothetical protein WA113_11990 [Desulfitobacteriaceae bacterium]
MKLTNELVLMLINIGTTGVAGFLLVLYLFLYSLQIKRIWRWLGGVSCGVVSGTIFAFVALFIDWP